MIKSRIYQVLVGLSTKDLKRFERFYSSPYHNSSERVSDLLTLLSSALRQKAAPPDKTKLWAEMISDKPYQDSTMRKLCNEALQLFESFVAIEFFQKDKALQATTRLKALKESNLSELYKSNVKKARTMLERQTDRAGDLFYHQYQLEQSLYDMQEGSVQRFDQINLDRILGHLDTFYVTEKLRFYCEILSRKSFTKHQYGNLLVEEILDLVQKGDFSDTPVVSIYHQIILTHLEPDQENHYFVLRNLLEQHGADLPKAEMSQVYQAALNYCNRQINNGKFYFLDESFALYKQFLKRELIFENGYITHWTFKNVVVLALRLKEYDWAKRFIHKYGQYIHESYRDNAITYNLAQLYFYQKKYTDVLTQLQAVQYKDVTYNLGSKAMLFATYYELAEWDALHSLAASFRLYINRRKQTISEKRRSSYIHFINFTLKLSKIRSGDLDAIDKLSSTINQTSSIASESWLKEKVMQKKQAVPI